MGHVESAPHGGCVSVARFLVRPEALNGTSAVLSGAERRHLRVRRLGVGSALVLTNGCGQERPGVVVALDHHSAVIRFTADFLLTHESPIRIILAQALLKGDKLDLVIEKTTELGVSELLLFNSERSVGRASAERQARWQRVVRSAAKQSQRSVLPTIAGPMSFESMLRYQTDAHRLLLWEASPPGGWTTPGGSLEPERPVLVSVGPEGGFGAAEVEQAANAGVRIVGLAPRILRAETAAIVAVTLCQFIWGDLGGTPSPSSQA